MFSAALNQLNKRKDGFVLQVEGGRVDHAGHSNDTGGILHEFLNLMHVFIALEFIESHPDTMLVVTTDHGTGGCQLDGAGSASMVALLWIVSTSSDIVLSGCSKTLKPRVNLIRILLKTALGINPADAATAIVQAALDAEVVYLSGALNQAFGKQLNELTAVGWTSDKHTSECVEALRLRSWFGDPRWRTKYEIFGILTKALGIKVEGYINKVPASQPSTTRIRLNLSAFPTEKINNPIMIRPLASCQRLEWSPE